VSARARWVITCVALAALVALAGATISHALPALRSGPKPLAAGPDIARPDAAWDSLFQAYGNLSGAWSGGDGAQSLLLPDGSTMWFFADTFFGKTYAGGIRSQLTSGGGHNSAVLYRDGHLGPTLSFPPGPFGYQNMADYTWVAPPPPYATNQYEVLNGDQLIDDGTVYKFFQLADKAIHPGGFTYKLIGTVVETFSLNPATDALTPTGGTPIQVEDTPGSDPIIWGEATVESGGYLYIYGVKPYNGNAIPYPLYLARVPVAGLPAGAPWQYYRGTPSCTPPPAAWQSSPRSATPLQTGVSAGFSVTDVNGTDVLLTTDGSSPGTRENAVAYYAACPTGFSAGSPRYPVYTPQLPHSYLAYEYRIVPQLSSGSEVLVSYNIDTTSLGLNFSNVSIYRPRFLDVKLPGIAGPSGHVIDPPP
jgi:hypothetical protein